MTTIETPSEATTSLPDPFERSEPVDLEPALEAVRNLGEFREKPPGLLDRLLDEPWIQDVLKRFDALMSGVTEEVREFLMRFAPKGMTALPDHVLTTVSYAVGAIVVFLALTALYGVLSWLRRKVRAQDPSILPGELPLSREISLQSADVHQKLAHHLAAQGDYAGAIRQLYLATLSHLDEKNLVAFEEARTNLEYLDELDRYGTKTLNTGFLEVSRLFEAIRYGGQEANQVCFGKSQHAAEQLANLIRMIARRGSRPHESTPPFPLAEGS